MKSKQRNIKIEYLIVLVLMLQSCGVITHARYGNGYKINIGNTWGKGEGKADYNNSGKRGISFNTERYRSTTLREMVKPNYIRNNDTCKTVFLRNPEIHYESVSTTLGSLKLSISNKNFNDSKPPLERNVGISAVLMFGSIAVIPLIPFLCMMLAPIALFFAIIGYRKIRKNKGSFRGEKLAIALMIISSAIIIFTATLMTYLAITAN